MPAPDRARYPNPADDPGVYDWDIKSALRKPSSRPVIRRPGPTAEQIDQELAEREARDQAAKARRKPFLKALGLNN